MSPDLKWPGDKIFWKGAYLMAGKVCKNTAGAHCKWAHAIVCAHLSIVGVRSPTKVYKSTPMLTSNLESLQARRQGRQQSGEVGVFPRVTDRHTRSVPLHCQQRFRRLPWPCQVEKNGSADYSRTPPDTCTRVSPRVKAGTGRSGISCRIGCTRFQFLLKR